MNQLGKVLVKVAFATKTLDLGPGKPQPTEHQVDRQFIPVSRLDAIKTAMLSELEALQALSHSVVDKLASESSDAPIDPGSPQTGLMLGSAGLAGGTLSHNLHRSNMGQLVGQKDRNLYRKLKETAEVPVLEGSADGPAFTPKAEERHVSFGPGGLKFETKELGPSVLMDRRESPAVLAHELGHAAIHNNRAGRLLQNKVTHTLGDVGSALPIGMASGALTGASDDSRIQAAGRWAPMAVAAPQLAYEAGASALGLANMRRHGASRKQLIQAAKQLAPAWGTYAAGPVLNTGAAHLTQHAVLKHRAEEQEGKLAAVSEERAAKALDRLDSLEQSKPTVGQVARYGALGAVAGPAIGAVGNAIAGKPLFSGKTLVRGIAADAAKGALGAGAVPLLRSQLDRRAEIGTLKKFVQQNPQQPEA